MLSNRTLIILTVMFTVIVLASVFLTSCNIHSYDHKKIKGEDATYGFIYLDNDVKYRTVDIDGHKYLLFKFYYLQNTNISIIHSESCPCKKKK